jgi:Uma2 family endonuclease
MTTTSETTSPEQVILLDHISWDTYLALRRDTDEQHIFITYDNGKMMIDRRGADVGALENVSWETYQRLLHELQHRRLQLTFDNGRLTIVSPSHQHDRIKTLIGGMIEIVALDWKIPMARLGSSTWVREDVWKGLESDECYYVQNEPRVRGKDQIDLATDPPPDLAIEVQIAHQDVDRPALYAALGVPELWHFRRERLRAMKLEGEKYMPIDFSLAFPALRPAELERFLAMRHTTDETTLMLSFQDWVRTLPR